MRLVNSRRRHLILAFGVFAISATATACGALLVYGNLTEPLHYPWERLSRRAIELRAQHKAARSMASFIVFAAGVVGLLMTVRFWRRQ